MSLVRTTNILSICDYLSVLNEGFGILINEQFFFLDRWGDPDKKFQPNSRPGPYQLVSFDLKNGPLWVKQVKKYDCKKIGPEFVDYEEFRQYAVTMMALLRQ